MAGIFGKTKKHVNTKMFNNEDGWINEGTFLGWNPIDLVQWGFVGLAWQSLVLFAKYSQLPTSWACGRLTLPGHLAFGWGCGTA